MFAALGDDAVGREPLDGVVAQVDQAHVVAVEGLEVATVSVELSLKTGDAIEIES